MSKTTGRRRYVLLQSAERQRVSELIGAGFRRFIEANIEITDHEQTGEKVASLSS
jgi:hypothetical protein